MFYKILECYDQRLLELGFTPGSEVFLIDLKWFGKVFRVRSALIGLRNSDLKFLKLEKIP